MNKDLDERLVPQGYYRDAQNIEIVTSEGSNVGSVQNVLGNQERRINKDGVAWSSNYINNLTNQECIGSIADTENNKIYWFIKSDNVSAIAEYDTVSKIVRPVLVDTKNILKFSSSYLITGINIIDGLLFWTDNQYEPKKVNVNDPNFITNDFANHSQYYGADFKEEHITVIKQSPIEAPILDMSATLQEGKVGIETNPLTSSIDFFNAGSLRKSGEELTITVDIFPTAWSRGSIIKITRVEVISGVRENLTVRAVIMKVSPSAGSVFVTIRILSVDERISSGSETYECSLEEDDPLYKLKFPRFAFRYKYDDGEYSCFSPFSDPAFIPGLYDYRPTTGTNLGMENRVREIEMTLPGLTTDSDNVTTFPKGVKSIDILYKESDSTNVRIVATLKNKTTLLPYKIEREVLKSLVESNQLTRPFDAVPKKAKAQEVIGNRIVYGNYTEGYNVDDDPIIFADHVSTDIIESQDFTYVTGTRKLTLSPDNFTEFPIQGTDVIVEQSGIELPFDRFPRLVNKGLTETFVYFTQAQPNAGTVTIKYDKKNRGIKSAKSQRTYQLGVVYQDKYGRQSPVFTDKTASTFIEKKNAAFQNKLVGSIASRPPSGATHYKWFVKEGASEYYNLVLSNYYTAEDGNVWLSFPSAEVNKIKVGDFIELKKKHNIEEVVTDNLKSKILDIALEPPPYIEFERVLIHQQTDVTGLGTDGAVVGQSTFKFKGPNNSAVLFEKFNVATRRVVRILTGTGSNRKVSKFYTVSTPSYTSSNTFTLNFTEAIVASDNWLETLTGTFTIELYDLQDRRGAELSGKFFAKIRDNDGIVQNIKLPSDSDKDWSLLTEFPKDGAPPIVKRQTSPSIGNISVTWELNHSGISTIGSNRPSNIVDDEDLNMSLSAKNHTHPEVNNAYFGLTMHGFSLPGNITSTSSNDEIHQALNQVVLNLPEDYASFKSLKAGAIIEFKDANENVSQRYKILPGGDFYNSDFKTYWDSTYIGTPQRYFTRVWKIGLLDQESEPYQDEVIFFDAAVGDNPATQIRVLKRQEDQILSESLIASPAVFETEPTDIADLDLYHEISNSIGIVRTGSTLKDTDASVANVSEKDRIITLDKTITGIGLNEVKTFVDTNGFETNITTSSTIATEQIAGQTVIHVAEGGHVGDETLPWFNCYAFGNGVESNRIRDDFNQVFIDKGPKVSTVLEREYVEEHKKASLIYSGIYVNKNGINETNQFLIADKITKDLNPEYGSIQKLEARDSNLISCNEDKIINIVANKDAIFNADGNPQLIASTNVLGQAVPYVGEYGISKNPESFVSYAYRSYFTDKARGVVLRLSRDGLTDISGKGMSDYFGDNLQNSTKLIGSYSEDKSEYILTLHKTDSVGNITSETVAYSESSGEGGGWTSFRSYIPESGLSINDTYYTFKNGRIYSHDNETRNTFYGGSAVESSINVLFNEASDTIKSFKTLAYEGSQQKRFRYLGTIDSVTYSASDNLTLARLIELVPDTTTEFNSLSAEERQAGWYLDSITTDLQSGSIQEFIGKENKFYNHLRGDSLTDANLDESEFSVQGLGTATVAEGDASGGNVGSQSSADVTITLAGLTNSNLELAGNDLPEDGGYTVSGNTFTKAFDTAANVSTVTLQVDLNALEGFDLPSSLTISGNANVTAYNSTTGVVTFTLTAGGAIGTDGHTETITITSAAPGVKNSVAGTYEIKSSSKFITAGDQLNTKQSYSATDYAGNKQTVVNEFTLITKTSTSGEKYVFGGYVGGIYNPPNVGDLLDIDIQNDSSAAYTLTISDTIKNADNEVVSMKLKIEYTFGSVATVTGDNLFIYIDTVEAKQAPSSPKIRSIVLGRLEGSTFVPDDSRVSYIGANDIRYFKVSGDVGAKFGITRFSPGSSIGYKLNDSDANIAQDALEITEGQNFELVKLTLPDRTGQQMITDSLFALNSTFLRSDIPTITDGSGNVGHVTVSQHALSRLKLQVESTDYGGSGSGIAASDVLVYEDDDRAFISNPIVTSFNSTANSADAITTQEQTEKEINSPDSPKKFIPFKFEFDRGGTDDDTLNRQPLETDFVHEGNGGGTDDDNFDIDITNLTATLTTGSGGALTKLTVFGMLIINKYGDATSNTGSSFNLLEFNPDPLVQQALISGGSSSLYVNLFGMNNVSTTTNRGSIPTSIALTTANGTNYTGTVTFLPYLPFFTGKTTSQITISYTLDGFSNNGSSTNPSGWTGAYTGGLATIAVNVNLNNASAGPLAASDAPLTIRFDAS